LKIVNKNAEHIQDLVDQFYYSSLF